MLTHWGTAAACRTGDPELFFLPSYAETAMAPHLERARAICARCPVTADCLQYALTTGQDDGIWGGTTPHQRRRLRTDDTDARALYEARHA